MIIALAWGACFLFIRIGLRDAPTAWFAALRALGAGTILLLAAEARGARWPRDARSWSVIAAMALVNVAVAFWAMFEATRGVATGIASALANTQPLLILLPAWWLYGERPSLTVLLAAAVGLVGVGLITGGAGGGGGAWLALVAAAAVTGGTLLARRLAGIDLVLASALQFLVGGLMLSGWAAATGPLAAIRLTPTFLIALAFLALAGSAVPTLLWFQETLRSDLSRLAIWTLLVPAIGVGLGVLVLGERPGPAAMIGLALILASLLATSTPGSAGPAISWLSARSRR